MMKHLIFVIFCLTIAQLVAADFSFVANTNFYATDFAALGSSNVNSSGLKITEQGDPTGGVILYNQKLPLANGFTTTFILDVTNCDSNYGGADGFTFAMFPEIPPRTSYFSGGSGLAITTLKNYAAITFVLASDNIGICAMNSSTDLGGNAVSVIDNTVLCEFNNTLTNVLKNLRCSGPHTINIKFTVPDQWEVTIDNFVTYYFTRNTTEILDWNYQAYVGFTGAVSQGYMNQYITSWSLNLTPGCLGVCDPIATCNVGQTVSCTCPQGYEGNGTVCLPVNPPGAQVIPILECFEDLGSGSYRAHFGYQNTQTDAVVIPEGADNQLVGRSATNLPSSFAPGRSPYYPLSAFKYEFNDTNTVTWHLTDYEVTLDVADRTKLCPVDLRVKMFIYVTIPLLPEPIIRYLSEEIQVSFGRITLFNLSYVDTLSKKRDLPIADLELEIANTNSTTEGEPSAAETVSNLVDVSKNTTRMNEIVNTDQYTTTNDFISTKTVPTGVETAGQQVVPPIAPPGSTTVPSAQNTPTVQNTPVKPSSDATMQLFNCFIMLVSVVLVIM